MRNRKFLDDFVRHLSDAVPPAAQAMQQDFERNLRTAVQTTLSKLDLVSRQEFDVQTKVLARSRAKIEQLEKQVAELEARLLNKD